MSDGLGAKKLAVEFLGAYIPKPYAFSGRVGYRISSSGSAIVWEEKVDVDMHLNDISENMGRSPLSYGRANGMSCGGLVTPNRWAWHGSVVFQWSKTSPMDATLQWSAKLHTGQEKEPYMARRLAATLTRCTMQCVPTSIAEAYSSALADMRHFGCLTTVKARASPDPTIQAVATNQMEHLDSVSKHIDEVKKVLPAGRVARRAVELQRPTQMSDTQPCTDQLFSGIDQVPYEHTANIEITAGGSRSLVKLPPWIRYAVLARTDPEL
jgi:hypothetical protein